MTILRDTGKLNGFSVPNCDNGTVELVGEETGKKAKTSKWATTTGQDNLVLGVITPARSQAQATTPTESNHQSVTHVNNNNSYYRVYNK